MVLRRGPRTSPAAPPVIWPLAGSGPRRSSRQNTPPTPLEAGRSAAQKRRARAAKERADRYRDVQVIPGRTLAETILVSQPSRHFYMSLLVAFMTFTLGWTPFAIARPPMMQFPTAVAEFDLLDAEEVDDSAATWIDTAFRQGEAGDSGRKLLAAFGWARAQYQGRHTPLRRGPVAALGSGRRAPGATRLPLPELMVHMLAVVMASLGMQAGWGRDLGIAIMVGFHLYLRPGELLRLQWGHLHSGLVGGKLVVGALLHPREGQQPSKTGVFDESTLVDLEPLARILEYHRVRRQPTALLVPCSPKEFHRLWREATLATGITKHLGEQHCYVLRHSGPSADRLSDRRPELEVKTRGRWKSDKSLKRYEKGGRVLEVLSRCTTRMKAFATRCEQQLWKVLAGSSAPPVPPPELRF